MKELIQYKPKHSEAGPDYKLAHEIVNTLPVNSSRIVSPEVDKTFRHYLYDLALKQDKQFTTRKRGEGSRLVARIS